MTVKSGLDVLVAEGFARLKGSKVALLGHPASVDASIVHLLDRCLEAGVDLVRLFGPEHGLLGDAQDMISVGDATDPRTGLPVKSLYGTTRDSLFLEPGDLDGVDVLLCDVQDIGTRFYTYQYTVAFALRAAAAAGVKVVVVDRPNPIGGLKTEGNLVRSGFSSFVGEYPLPMRTGLTLGELVLFFNEVDEGQSGRRADVEVVWMEGWRRSMHADDTGLPWVLPSPNMPTPLAALVYPGGCLYEGTNLSEGRGTTRPFELVGAPYIDDANRFAELASTAAGDGVELRPCTFRPMFQKHGGQPCRGVQLHVTDRDAFEPVRTAVAIIAAARTFPGFDWRREPYEFVADRLAIDLLFGDDRQRLALEAASEPAAGAEAVMDLLAEDRPEVDRLTARLRHSGYPT